jgi:S-(hydroxymethyl)glutathione dehydrogenase / alcohol dehydrogenase
MPLDRAALIGCSVTTGLGSVFRTAQVPATATVAVIGCGGVGLSIVQGARIAGAKTIVAVDPVASKRALATTLGATHAVDPSAENPVRAVRRIAGGGVHYAFEAVGKPETIATAWGMLRTSGLCVVVGVPKVDAAIPLVAGGFLQEKRVTGSVYGSCTPRRDFPRFLDWVRRGELRLAPMITNRIGLESVNDAFAAFDRGEEARTVIVHRV